MLNKTHKLTFTFFDVGGGDALWIRYFGNDDNWHNILIDGGFGNTYKYVFGPLIKSILVGEIIDLWIISHTDLDHIGGVLGFIRDNKIKDKKAAVKKIWFNYSPLELSDSNGKLGVRQGIELRNYLDQMGMLLKDNIITEQPTISLFGLSLSILSPSKEKLDIANQAWKVKERKGKLGRTSAEGDHRLLIEELGGSNFSEDTDTWNGSSIACLIEFGEIRTVLLADSHPSVIVDSIKNKYPSKLPIDLNFLQLAHHGSKANNSSELLDLFKCSSYVITGNGHTNQHPDKETLVRVLTKSDRGDETVQFIFPAETENLAKLFDVDSKATERYNFQCVFPKSGDSFVSIKYLPINAD
jgi:beta-lactamase superfamily II metal-dependent hydrolase